MAGNNREMNGDLIRHHVTDAQISENSFWYPISDFLNNIGQKVSFLPDWMSIPFSKHVAMLWVAAIFTMGISLWATRRYRTNKAAQPKGISHIYELLLEFIKNDIIIPNIGLKDAKRWTPLAASFFIFILMCNFIGLIPFFEKLGGGGGATPTGNFGVTLGLATITFFAIIIAGTLKHGFIGHWKNMIPHGVPAPVLIILIPIEIIGMFVKPMALTLRLGANMTAGHIGMLAIFGLPYLIGSQGVPSEGLLPQPSWGFAIIAVMLNVGVFFLEIIVSLVQAYVFTLLSSVFIGMAIHAEH
ncbi:MAG: ATP synthase F0 subunit A [Candidatus Marinimicrobia bacterium]|nr:ATP synthase F0 subunit A [Candidatus Neomarinimicrobiota bacterium]|tara:strand:- start:46360 stop:47259 length:900 start_codon:yes stop_codon:yes gene_type:complete